ncbi:MAG: GDP-mannose 4,6-dehydratase, partial [Gemmatimonadota bacterium]|nr:GDP-mannose 4,6-dehydratase [Gemmatimonadota bacterium]
MTSLHLPLEMATPRTESVASTTAASPRSAAMDFAIRQAAKAGLDFMLVSLAAITSLALEYGSATFHSLGTLKYALGTGLLVIAAHAAQGSYRAIWRYTSLREAISIAISSTAMLVVLLGARAVELTGVTGSTLVLTALLTLVFCFSARGARRWQSVERKPDRGATSRVSGPGTEPRRVLIAGAGEHGLSIARDIMKSELANVELVGFVDDDRAKIGASLHGARVLGPVRDLLSIAEEHGVSEVIVAMPSADPAMVRALVRRVEDTGLRVRMVRGVERFVMGRDLHRPGTTTAKDLLNRPSGNGRLLADGPERRRVLITGGAGFIGSHLTRMLLEAGYHVRLLDRFDYGRSGIDALMHPRLEVHQGDICSSRDVSRAVRGVERFVMGRDLHRPGTTTANDLLNRTSNGNGRPLADGPERRRVLV